MIGFDLDVRKQLAELKESNQQNLFFNKNVFARWNTPCQNHLYIEDESQNFDEMRVVGSSSPARGRFRNFSTFDLASSSTDDFGTGYFTCGPLGTYGFAYL